MSLEGYSDIISRGAHDASVWGIVLNYLVIYLIIGPCVVVLALKVLTSDRVFSLSVKALRNLRLLASKLTESKWGVFFTWLLWPLYVFSIALDLLYLSGWFNDDVVDLGKSTSMRKRRKRRRGFGRLYKS